MTDEEERQHKNNCYDGSGIMKRMHSISSYGTAHNCSIPSPTVALMYKLQEANAILTPIVLRSTTASTRTTNSSSSLTSSAAAITYHHHHEDFLLKRRSHGNTTTSKNIKILPSGSIANPRYSYHPGGTTNHSKQQQDRRHREHLIMPSHHHMRTSTHHGDVSSSTANHIDDIKSCNKGYTMMNNTTNVEDEHWPILSCPPRLCSSSTPSPLLHLPPFAVPKERTDRELRREQEEQLKAGNDEEENGGGSWQMLYNSPGSKTLSFPASTADCGQGFETRFTGTCSSHTNEQRIREMTRAIASTGSVVTNSFLYATRSSHTNHNGGMTNLALSDCYAPSSFTRSSLDTASYPYHVLPTYSDGSVPATDSSTATRRSMIYWRDHPYIVPKNKSEHRTNASGDSSTVFSRTETNSLPEHEHHTAPTDERYNTKSRYDDYQTKHSNSHLHIGAATSTRSVQSYDYPPTRMKHTLEEKCSASVVGNEMLKITLELQAVEDQRDDVLDGSRDKSTATENQSAPKTDLNQGRGKKIKQSIDSSHFSPNKVNQFSPSPSSLIKDNKPETSKSEFSIEFPHSYAIDEDIECGGCGLVFLNYDPNPEYLNRYVYVPGVQLVKKRATIRDQQDRALKKKPNAKRAKMNAIELKTSTESYKARLSFSNVSVNLGSYENSASAAAAVDIANVLFWGEENTKPLYLLSLKEIEMALDAIGIPNIKMASETFREKFDEDQKFIFESYIGAAVTTIGGNDDALLPILCSLEKYKSNKDKMHSKKITKKNVKSSMKKNKRKRTDPIIDEQHDVVYEVDDDGVFSWRKESVIKGCSK